MQSSGPPSGRTPSVLSSFGIWQVLCTAGENTLPTPFKNRTIGPIIDYRYCDSRLEDLDPSLAVNVRAVFVATQAAVKHMHADGRIINVGCCNAERVPFTGGGVYAMSEAALVGLVKGLARDLGPRGITINKIQPGPVETDRNPAAGGFAGMQVQVMALPRYGSGEEIASLVAYLASPEATYGTGASLAIVGGFTP